MKSIEDIRGRYKSEEWWESVRSVHDNIVSELYNDPEDVKRGVVSEFNKDIPTETRIKLRTQLMAVLKMIGDALGEFNKNDSDKIPVNPAVFVVVLPNGEQVNKAIDAPIKAEIVQDE